MQTDAVERALEKVLTSTAFSRTQRLRRFLEYVVLESLAGRGDRLKEYAIGAVVFERGTDFDPRLDTIVRVEAIKLRERLKAYYRGEGATDSVVIELPKGSYTPHIEFRQAAAAGFAPEKQVELARSEERPSVVVLPFVNISADKGHDYLSDGITENIITGLSRFRDLTVIASSSAFSYKGKALKIQDVRRELGVRFVLEGSVQKSSDRVRITAQLIDAITGAHLWAEQYDRGAEDIITILDEVTEIIVASLATAYGGRLRKAWRGRVEKSTPQNIQAFDHFQRGIDIFDDYTPGCMAGARESFLRAIELEPAYAKAYAKIAFSHLIDVWFGWSEDTAHSMAEALKYATHVIACDDDEAWGHWAMAYCHLFSGQHDRAIAAYQRALELNPNDPDVMCEFGACLSYAGRAEEGVEMVRKAMRLNPHYPEWWLMTIGQIYHDARRYEDAIAALESSQKIDTIGNQLYLAASHAALGHDDRARAAVTRVMHFNPKAAIRSLAPSFLDVYKEADDREHLRANLLKAGLQE